MATAPPLDRPFVRSDVERLRSVLVAPPTAALGALTPIRGEAHAIADRAAEQFAVFTSRLAASGVAVAHVPQLERPPSPACADAAVVFEAGAFLMRPSDPARRGDVAAVEAALAAAGVPVVGRVEAPGLLDGGDALVVGGTLYLGVPLRRGNEVGVAARVHGNATGREQLAAYARAQGLAVREVPMASEVHRLRAVASAIDAETVLFAPGLLDAAAFAGVATIEVPRGEDYAAGVLTVAPRRVLANVKFRETLPRLRKAKVIVEAIDLWELGKAGITPSLLALPLKRG